MPSLINEHQQWFADDTNALIVNGNVYIGTVGLDPTVLANQIVIYSDRALTTPIANPQPTDANGQATNKIWIPTTKYSIAVTNSAGVVKYSELDNGDEDITTANTMASLLSASINSASVDLLGFHSSGDGGGGEFYYDSAESRANHDGITIIDPTNTADLSAWDATAKAAWFTAGTGTGCWKRIYNGPIRLEWGGAKVDNSDDDILIWQQAVTKFITLTGGHVVFDGFSKITDEIPIPFSARWIIEGESRGSSKIIQHTLNKPIFRFTTANTHSWTIQRMTLDYNTQQTSTQSEAIPVYFPTDTGSPGAGYYNFVLNDLYIDNCYRCIAHDTVNQAAVWGFNIDNVIMGESCTGSFCYLGETSSLGMPNCHFGKIYILANSVETAESIFDLVGCSSTTMTSIEINQATNGPRILNASEGTRIDSLSFKIEGGTYSTTGARLFDIPDSFFNVSTLRMSTLTFNPGASNEVSILGHSSGNGLYQIKTLGLDGFTITSGVVYIAQGASSGGNFLRGAKIDYLDPADVITNMHLTDLPSTSGADGVRVLNWMEPRISDDKGDADYTVSIGDSTIIRYDTALTALRTVTLPSVSGSAEGSSFNGLSYTVTRSGGGAFDLNIDTSTGTIDTIPSGNTGSITFTFRRFAWVVTNRYLV